MGQPDALGSELWKSLNTLWSRRTIHSDLHGAGWGVRLVDCVGSQDGAPVASMAPALPRAAKSYREGYPQGAGPEDWTCLASIVCVSMSRYV